MKYPKFGRRTLTVMGSALVAALACAALVAPAQATSLAADSTAPPGGVTPKVITTPADGFFSYVQASQRVVADGGLGYFTIEKPVVAAADYHSLAEIAVSSSDGNQAVELGWSVDPGRNGDSEPHLFVFHWVDGNRTCYNGCGFVTSNDPFYSAGMKLPVTTKSVQFAIWHHGPQWLVGYNQHWIGWFPDSLWSSRFTLTGAVQWFGEVNGPTANSCTTMGNGQPATSATAARIEKIALLPSRLVPDINTGVTDANAYSVLQTGANSIRYGGAGNCRTVPALIGETRKVATSTIVDAGLIQGAATPKPDPLCEDLDNVLDQNPAPGARVPAGSAVDFSYGAPPKTGCPNPRA